MSYSALILKDSPEVFWDLNMNTGTTVKSDPFVSDSAYNGTAFTFSRSAVPITYGGIACIQNNGSYTENYSSNNKIFSIFFDKKIFYFFNIPGFLHGTPLIS